jgi:hypothetical protein
LARAGRSRLSPQLRTGLAHTDTSHKKNIARKADEAFFSGVPGSQGPEFWEHPFAVMVGCSQDPLNEEYQQVRRVVPTAGQRHFRSVHALHEGAGVTRASFGGSNATGSPALEVSESGDRFGYSAPPWQLHVPMSIGGGDRSFRSRW